MLLATGGRAECFVIMPFSKSSPRHTEEYWTEHFEKFLKPLIEEVGEVEVVRSQPFRADIRGEIIKELITAPIVVADLTDGNLNVYWELGVRQSFKNGTITVAEKGTDLPFHLGSKGTLFYDTEDYAQIPEFSRLLRGCVQDCLAHPETTDSMVLETITGRGSMFEIVRRDEVKRRMGALFHEIRYNRWVVKRTLEQVAKNEEELKAGRGAVTSADRPISAAAELLYSNRYLDAPQELYNAAIAYIKMVNAWEYYIDDWGHNPEAEAWFKQTKELVDNVADAFEKALSTAKENSAL